MVSTPLKRTECFGNPSFGIGFLIEKKNEFQIVNSQAFFSNIAFQRWILSFLVKISVTSFNVMNDMHLRFSENREL